MFIPKLFTILKEGYKKQQFFADLSAGVIVGIVALPLAIAFAIASGVTPEKGLYTAIIAGFIISAFGGSRVQIGGPTGAFIVIVYGLVQQYGVEGLTIATFIAGIMIILMGLAGLGTIIRYIPYSLIVGFTSGIALIIFSSQVKDFFGLEMGSVPSDFIEKWIEYFKHFNSINIFAVIISLSTILITIYFSKITKKIPGSLIAIILSTFVVYYFKLDVETIETKFGNIPSSLPSFTGIGISWEIVRNMIQPAFTIALLASIESLLSASVADGMIGGNHRSNIELIAQGAANVASSLFGGIPATGAIARTATNVKNGGRTPIAGIIHAITLLIIMLFVGKWAKLIPLSCLSGILIVVAYNMSGWRSFYSIAKGPSEDVIVLLTSFFLTVIVDLTVAIEISMILAAFLFVRRISKTSNVNYISDVEKNENIEYDPKSIPKEIDIFEVNGPLFFGAAYKFKEVLREIKKPKILIVRMRNVPIIDSTGLNNLKEIVKELQNRKIKIILSEAPLNVSEIINKSRIAFLIGKKNICNSFEDSLSRAKEILLHQ